jgi:hypothetical protein
VSKTKHQLELWNPSWDAADLSADLSAKHVEKEDYPDSPPDIYECYSFAWYI